jgi:hypothetical protein
MGRKWVYYMFGLQPIYKSTSLWRCRQYLPPKRLNLRKYKCIQSNILPHPTLTAYSGNIHLTAVRASSKQPYAQMFCHWSYLRTVPQAIWPAQIQPPPFISLTILSDVHKSRSSVSGNIPNSSFTSLLFGPNFFWVLFLSNAYNLFITKK